MPVAEVHEHGLPEVRRLVEARPSSVWKVTWNASTRAGATRPVVIVSTSATGHSPHVALCTSTFSRPEV